MANVWNEAAARAASAKLAARAATRAVHRFYGNTTRLRRDKIAATALRFNAICGGEAKECIAFGIGQEDMDEFFRYFRINRRKNYMYSVTTIGETAPPYSSNGFIKKIQFKKEGFSAFAILKSSKKASADNLLYECIVGKYINFQALKFTCFVQTYGLYKYVDQAAYLDTLSSSYTTDAHGHVIPPTRANPTSVDLVQRLRFVNMIDLSQACTNPERYAVLTQFFGGAQSLYDFIRDADKDALEQNLFQILYQVYYPLSQLHANFTHYDLHPRNVMVYEVPNQKHVIFQYVIAGNVFSFPCRYIAKIIDYGRSYFYMNDEFNSARIAARIKGLAECQPECGRGKGFRLMEPGCPGQLEADRFAYVVSSVRNASSDLRLLFFIVDNFNANTRRNQNGLFHDRVSGSVVHNYSPLTQYFEDLIYGFFDKVIFTHHYGTPEIMAPVNDATYIYNVISAAAAIQTALTDVIIPRMPAYAAHLLHGTLRSAVGQPVVYTPYVPP